MSVYIRKVLRSAISTQGFLDFVCLHANAVLVPKFPVATAWFSCNFPRFRSIKPLWCRGYQIISFSKLYNSTLIQIIKIPWPLSQATTSDCYYQEEERAKPSKFLANFALPVPPPPKLALTPCVSSPLTCSSAICNFLPPPRIFRIQEANVRLGGEAKQSKTD
jgi:hypothetical protein